MGLNVVNTEDKRVEDTEVSGYIERVCVIGNEADGG